MEPVTFIEQVTAEISGEILFVMEGVHIQSWTWGCCSWMSLCYFVLLHSQNMYTNLVIYQMYFVFIYFSEAFCCPM